MDEMQNSQYQPENEIAPIISEIVPIPRIKGFN
jgi:hypothetical protein